MKYSPASPGPVDHLSGFQSSTVRIFVFTKVFALYSTAQVSKSNISLNTDFAKRPTCSWLEKGCQIGAYSLNRRFSSSVTILSLVLHSELSVFHEAILTL